MKKGTKMTIGAYLLIVGTIMVYYANITARLSFTSGYDPFTPVYFSVFLGGLAMILYGCYIWVESKNRSAKWMLMGLLAPFGFIALARLKSADVRTPEGKK